MSPCHVKSCWCDLPTTVIFICVSSDSPSLPNMPNGWMCVAQFDIRQTIFTFCQFSPFALSLSLTTQDSRFVSATLYDARACEICESHQNDVRIRFERVRGKNGTEEKMIFFFYIALHKIVHKVQRQDIGLNVKSKPKDREKRCGDKYSTESHVKAVKKIKGNRASSSFDWSDRHAPVLFQSPPNESTQPSE